MKGWGFHVIAVYVVFATTGFARNIRVDSDKKAVQVLFSKLQKVITSLDMKNGRFAATAPGQSVDPRSGTPTHATNTYHDMSESWCIKRKGESDCEEWLPAGASEHGIGNDNSTSEKLGGKFYQQYKSQGEQVSGNKVLYSLWEFEFKKPQKSILDYEGKIDPELTKVGMLQSKQLRPEVAKEFQKMGYDLGEQLIQNTIDAKSESEKKKTLSAPEMHRAMAGNLTWQLYQHVLTKAGDGRAAQEGVKVALNAARNCEQYGSEVKRAMQNSADIDERLPQQAAFDSDPLARTASIQERVEACRKLMQAPIDMVNPTWDGSKVTAGDANEEQLTDKLNREQAMALLNPSDSARKSTRGDWTPGATELRLISETNAQTIADHNQNLADAAASYENAAKRMGGKMSENITEHILAEQIDPSTPVMFINGPTLAMGRDGAKAGVDIMQNETPAERSPDELERTVARVQQTSITASIQITPAN